MRPVRVGLFLIAGALALAPRAARAQSAEQIAFAAHEHDLGYAAYSAQPPRYEEAATHFENAFLAAPKPEELKAAVTARRRAKDYARAATFAALGEARFPDDANTHKLANDTIAEARPHVFEVKVDCDAACDVVADGKLVPLEKARSLRFFVDPGHHELVVGFGEKRNVTKPIDATAGGHDTFAVSAPPLPPPPPADDAQTPSSSATSTLGAAPPARDTTPPHTKPFGPALFFVGLGLTAAAGGVAIWSGIDAQDHPGKDAVLRDCVGLGESCPTYQDGLSAQRRTNILLAATGGLALATAVVGLFFTQWSSPGRATEKTGSKLTIRPSLEVRGSTPHLGVTGEF